MTVIPPLAIMLFSMAASPVYAWQLGWSTTDSQGARGINVTQYNDQIFLKGSIGILQAFYDDKSYWINIGVGNDVAGSGCSNPPVLWEEVINSNNVRVAHNSLGCLSYNSTSQLSIIYDSRAGYNAWGWFNAQGELTTYDTGGIKVGTSNPSQFNMIESNTTTSSRSPTYQKTIFTNGLQYTTSTYGGTFPSFSNPSTPATYRNSAPSYFDTSRNSPAPWSFDFSWHN